MRNKGDNCHMAFSPQESPIYGGGQIVVVFSETSDLPGLDAEIFLVFQGSKSRHVTLARRLDYHTIQAIIPGHNSFESVHLSVYASEGGNPHLISEGTLNFVQDSTYYLAQFLASSVSDITALENPSSIKSERFNLWTEDMSTLDERLTTAFEHLELSPSWRLVEDTSRLEQDPPPRETLLHFATRLGLPQFAEHLLGKEGSDIALRLPNQNGELAVALARSHGLDDLADRMNEHDFGGSSHQSADLGRVQSKSVMVKRHSLGTATISTNTTEDTRSLEEDIQMLKEIVSFMGVEVESPPAGRSTEDPPSPDYFSVGSLPARLPSEMLPSRMSSDQSSQQYFSAADEEDEDRGDEDEDEDEETEIQENIPEEEVLGESMAHVHVLKTKVQRLRASNKEYLTAEDARRESLSRFSSSCPVLADESEKIHIPRIVLTPPPFPEKSDIPMRGRAATNYHQSSVEEEDESTEPDPSILSPDPLLLEEEDTSFPEADITDAPFPTENSVSTEPFAEDDVSFPEEPIFEEPNKAVRILVDDVSAEVNRSEGVTPSGLTATSRQEQSSSPSDSVNSLQEPEHLSRGRRNSWGSDPTDEVISPTEDVSLPLSLSARSKSMGNLDRGSEQEFHDAKELLTPKTSRSYIEGSPDRGPSATSSPIDGRGAAERQSSPDVISDDATDLNTNEVDVTTILPPDNATSLPTRAEIEAVPLRKKNQDTQKQSGRRKVNSLFAPSRTIELRTDGSSNECSMGDEPLTPPLPNSAPPVVTLTLTPRTLDSIQSVVEVEDDSDISRDSDLDDGQKDLTAKQRKARLSLTEFLNDPRNFQGDPEAAAAALKEEQEASQSPIHARTQSMSASDMDQPKGVIRKFSFLRKNRTKTKDPNKPKEENKKDKERGKHQFVTVSFSNSTKCDFCDKSMANRDALQCITCQVNVHNSSCKDHVQGCTKLTKHPKPKPNSGSQNRLSAKPGTSLGYSQSVNENSRRPTSSGNFTSKLQQLPFQGSLTDLRLHGIPSSVGTIEESEELEEDEDNSPKASSLSNNNISVSMESLDEVTASTLSFEEDEDLVSKGPEPESWSVTAEKKVLKKMSHKEIKRQDVIFEFIKTEKHHLRTLKIMQKIFSLGMHDELKMEPSVINKVFPSLEELVKVAVQFNEALQSKQRDGHPVETIGDVLVNQFDKENGKQMMEAYAYLCCRQIEAVALYKELYKTDRKFQAFIKRCSTNALCRRWSIPECILSVTNRLTKYHLLIGAIMKPTKAAKVDKSEYPNLQKALQLVKNICQDVNVRVNEYERHQRLMDIYNKLEAKSSGMLKSGKKFKKSDLLSSNRKLRHEGELRWKSARGKLTDVNVVVLSDVVILLQENNQKYAFASQDSKPPVIHLHKLMVRDVAVDKCSIYLISPNKAGPEMYEVNCENTDKRKKWKEILEQAIIDCPDEDEGVGEDAETDEEKKATEARAAKIKKLLDEMQEKDNKINEIMEEKAKLVEELKDTLNKDDVLGTLKSPIIADNDCQMQEARQILLAAIAEAHRLTAVVYSAGAGLTRSASSAGERESGLFQVHSLPKRAETFGGFDKQQAAPVVKKRFTVHVKEPDSRSYSVPNLTKVDGVEQNVVELHPQQGSDPNLLSESYQDNTDMLKKDQDRLSDNSSRLTVDSNSSMSEDVPEGLLRDEKAVLSPDHVLSVNHLLKHLNSLLCLTTRKETAYERMRSQLLEANIKIKSLSGTGEAPKMRHYKSNSMGTQGLASLTKSPSSVDRERFSSIRERTKKDPSETKDKSRKDSSETKEKLRKDSSQESKGKTSEKDKGKRDSQVDGKSPYEPPFAGVRTNDQSLRKIAFGEILYDDNSVHASHGLQAESPKSIMKHRAGSDITRPTHGEQQQLEKASTRTSRRDLVPEHLLSATNELQASSGLVQQQLPMKLSTLASLSSSSSFSSSSKPQQMIPNKLTSSKTSSTSPVPTRNGNKVSPKADQKSTQLNNQRSQGPDQNVIYF
ncbi:rho guanine nucleotide exchange factor 28-like isoform X2 [Asterias amurensis]|uniref:rho guanine nucleotide exchange factor 28-like isoform X2 n=1 Tax=Asterias amurensis TaxID=7602 RepID=UPI003AB1DC25